MLNYNAALSLDAHPRALIASSRRFLPAFRDDPRPLQTLRHNASRMFIAVLAAALLAACAGAPVQEMSDARQAVAAAEQALGGKPATPDVIAARQYLQSAQSALDANDFSTAREDARLARQLALRALGIGQPQDASGRLPQQ
jgi:hypothetical protein